MQKEKVSAPGLPAGIVLRERLFRLLEKSSEKPAVWISGPGGSGKTTLVSSYLEARKLPTLWYQVDQRDADPATFFYFMGLALRESVCADQEPLPLLTPEYLAGIKAFARRYFVQLFRQLPVPSAIVLDNYQDVSSSSPFHELVMEGLLLIPDGVTLIVLSRNEPPPVLSVPESVERFEFLGWSDLRFSFEEAKQFALTQTDCPLETEALSRLYTKTDGWIAGLLMVLESLKESALDYQLLDKLPLDKVFGYFADKIFDASDHELQEFLLKTVFAPEITAHMAAQLTGIGSSEQILTRLSRNRFFTEKHSSVDPVYQYHPLFREFLLARAEKTFSAEEVIEIRRNAATLLEEAGRTEDAAGLLLQAADWGGLTQLILNSAPIFVCEGRSDAVLAWLECLPGETVARVPGLLYWMGVCQLLHSPSRSRDCFRKAFDLYRQANEKVGMFLSWSGGAQVSLYDGEFTPLDQWLSLLDGMQMDDFSFPSQQLEEQVVMSIFNAMAFRQPQHPDINKWRDRAAPLVRGSSDLDFRLQSAVYLLVFDLWNGEFGRATFLLDQAQVMVRSRKVSPMTEITLLNAQVLHAFYNGAWARGVAVAVDALRMADETGVHVWDSQLMGNGTACALSMGDHATADRLLQSMESRLEWFNKRIDFGQYHGLRGWRDGLRKDYPAALRHLELSVEAFHDIGFLAPEVVSLGALVENLRAVGEAERAEVYLSRAFDIAYGMKSRYLEFICLLHSAQFALDACGEAQAQSLLRRAMSLGAAGGYLSGWFWQPAALLRLCLKALESDIEVNYVRGLIRRWSLVPETPPLHIESWPWPLKIRTLGGFELLVNDEPVVLIGKAKKPLELLKALVSFGAKSVPLERLSDALWPDADGDMAKRSFDTTLHRLRKLLGCEKALQIQSGRLSIDPRHCWIDIRAFERFCAEVEEGLKGKGPGENAGNLPISYERAVALYRGHFLPDDTHQSWTLSMREQMRGRSLQLSGSADGYREALE
jgi:tetratricopeptide (TPR) repeat protein